LYDHQFVDEEGKVWTEVTNLSYDQALAFYDAIRQSESEESRMMHLESIEALLQDLGFFNIDNEDFAEYLYTADKDADH
jgi:hypothetical protein